MSAFASERLGRTERAERVREALFQVGLPWRSRRRSLASSPAASVNASPWRGRRVIPPEVLLCDEPTSALDVSLAATVLNLIGRLRRELGMAVLFVTHDLAAAPDGRRPDRGDVPRAASSRSAPRTSCASRRSHPYTKALLSTVPDLDRPKHAWRASRRTRSSPRAGAQFHPRCPVAVPSCSIDSPALVGWASTRRGLGRWPAPSSPRSRWALPAPGRRRRGRAEVAVAEPYTPSVVVRGLARARRGPRRHTALTVIEPDRPRRLRRPGARRRAGARDRPPRADHPVGAAVHPAFPCRGAPRDRRGRPATSSAGSSTACGRACWPPARDRLGGRGRRADRARRRVSSADGSTTS